MRKLLTVLALVAFSTSVMAATTSNSRIETFVNKKLAPITQKEKDFNAKVDAQQNAEPPKDGHRKTKTSAIKKAARS